MTQFWKCNDNIFVCAQLCPVSHHCIRCTPTPGQAWLAQLSSLPAGWCTSRATTSTTRRSLAHTRRFDTQTHTHISQRDPPPALFRTLLIRMSPCTDTDTDSNATSRFRGCAAIAAAALIWRAGRRWVGVCVFGVCPFAEGNYAIFRGPELPK